MVLLPLLLLVAVKVEEEEAVVVFEGGAEEVEDVELARVGMERKKSLRTMVLVPVVQINLH